MFLDSTFLDTIYARCFPILISLLTLFLTPSSVIAILSCPSILISFLMPFNHSTFSLWPFCTLQILLQNFLLSATFSTAVWSFNKSTFISWWNYSSSNLKSRFCLSFTILCCYLIIFAALFINLCLSFSIVVINPFYFMAYFRNLHITSEFDLFMLFSKIFTWTWSCLIPTLFIFSTKGFFVVLFSETLVLLLCLSTY